MSFKRRSRLFLLGKGGFLAKAENPILIEAVFYQLDFNCWNCLYRVYIKIAETRCDTDDAGSFPVKVDWINRVFRKHIVH